MTYTATDRRRVKDGEYRRRYELAKLRGIPTAPVPSGPAVAHLRALTNLGWSTYALSAMTGGVISDTTVNNLAGDNPHLTLHRATARAILRIPYTLAPSSDVPDTCLVPMLGAQRRVQALMRLGWTHAHMREIGRCDTTHPASGCYDTMLARKWRQIDALYRQLHMKPGPSTKTIARARSARHAPPLAWVDIDDPSEKPYRNPHENASGRDVVDRAVVTRLLNGERLPSTKAEKEEAMRRWLESGKPARHLSQMHGWQDGRYNPRQEPAA